MKTKREDEKPYEDRSNDVWWRWKQTKMVKKSCGDRSSNEDEKIRILKVILNMEYGISCSFYSEEVEYER